jgi:hypothetical protein
MDAGLLDTFWQIFTDIGNPPAKQLINALLAEGRQYSPKFAREYGKYTGTVAKGH